MNAPSIARHNRTDLSNDPDAMVLQIYKFNDRSDNADFKTHFTSGEYFTSLTTF